MQRLAGLLVMAVVATTMVPAAAQAAIRTVDDDKAQCPAAGYTTIHSAISDAQPGDTISVCRGTYTGEHVVDVDGLDIVSSTATAAAVIDANGANGFFMAGGVQDVSIRRFRIVGGTSSSGIVGNEDAEYELIRENVIQGFNNGIELHGGADATLVRDNHISGFNSVGIKLYDGGTSIDARNNTVLGTPGSRGIEFGAGTQGLAFGNSVARNGNAGIYAGGDGQTIKANTISQNGVGLLVDFGTGTIANNKIGSNLGQGILALAGGYTFASNNAKGNGGQDCEDQTFGSGTAGSANTWIANYGYDWNREGICTPS